MKYLTPEWIAEQRQISEIVDKVSNKHPQGRGCLNDDEDVQDVVVVRFADTAQVLAVADRLSVLADAMAEKTGLCSENAPAGAESGGAE